MFFYRIFVALFTLGALLPQPGADARIAAISPIEGTLGVHNFSGLVKDINQINVEEVVAVGNVLPELEKVAALFFPDAEQLVYTMKQASNTSWYGEVENATGMANFNYIDGRLSGSATFNDTIFHIITRPLFDNSRAVDGLMTHATRLNINDLPEGQEPKCNGDCDQSNEVDVDTISDDPADYDTIDTMIVYTYQAMCAEASQEFPCEITPENKKPIEDRAALAVEEANTAYELSGVLGRQRLLHVEMVDETYMEKETFDEMLDDLSSTDDGVIDGVHALRDEYGADLVSMFVNNAVSCGLAWLFNTAPQNGFSVVCTDCSTGYYSYAHELAHNTGKTMMRSPCSICCFVLALFFNTMFSKVFLLVPYDAHRRTSRRNKLPRNIWYLFVWLPRSRE